MKKHFIAIFSFILGLAVVIPSFGYAIWYFNDAKTSSNEDSSSSGNTTLDNIYENSSYGRNLTGDTTYTIYFFPSSIYLKEYKDYLNGVSGATLPENLFSSEDTPTALTFDVDSNGDYDTSSLTSTNPSTSTTDYLSKQGSKYIDYIETNYSTNGSHLSADSVLSNDYAYTKPNYDYSRSQYSANGHGSYTNTWGNSTTDSYNDMQDVRYDGSDREDRYNSKYAFEDDRFGYWKGKDVKPDNGNDSLNGRYSPIKIEVTNYLTQDLFNAIPDPYTSMGDGYSTILNGSYYDEWYDLQFCSWAYLTDTDNELFYDRYDFDSTSTGSSGTYDFSKYHVVEEADYLLDPFRTVNTQNLFDLTEDLSKYADENNVIRLFPIFSNGKHYNATTTRLDYATTNNNENYGDNGVNDPSLAHGGLATSYLTYTEDGETYKRHLLYNGDSSYMVTKSWPAYADYNREALSWVYYSSIKDFYYDESKSNIKFYVASNRQNLCLYNTWATNDTVNNYLNNFMSSLSGMGEGLYNIYMFYTNQYLSSVSQVVTPPSTNKTNTNNNTVTGYFLNKNHFDSYVMNTDMEANNIRTMSDGYKSGISYKQYNFAYNGHYYYDCYMNYSSYGGPTRYLNAFLQTSGNRSYYKTNFETLANKDLNFISVSGLNDNSGTFYGDFSTTYVDSSNYVSVRRDSNQGYTYGTMSQIVVAIEKVNEPRFVTGTFDSSSWNSYPLLYRTSIPSYKVTDGATTTLNSSNQLDSEYTYFVRNVRITNTSTPISVWISRKYQIPSSKIILSNSGYAIYYGLNLTSTSAALSNQKFQQGSNYFTVSSNYYYAKDIGVYDIFFYQNSDNNYEVYVHKHEGFTIRLYANDSFKQSVSTYNFLNYYNENLETEKANGLLWKSLYQEFDSSGNNNYLTKNSTANEYYYGSNSSFDNVLYAYSSANGNASYLIKDYATSAVIGYFSQNSGTKFLFDDNNSYTRFIIQKSCTFYLEKTDLVWQA